MGIRNNLRYGLRMSTNVEIAAAGMVVPGLVGTGPKIGSMAGVRHEQSGSCPNIGTRSSH